MNTPSDLAERLKDHQPSRLDVSQRGSGLNAVWRITLNDQPVILKTYHLRRPPLKTFFTNLEHAISGRTPYTAAARCRTERLNLQQWSTRGFDVPTVIDYRFTPDLSLPYLCMALVEGPLLSEYLTDDAISDEAKSSVFSSLIKANASRHEVASHCGNTGLIQEHPGIEHIIVSGDRLVTFDLEVSYRPLRPMAGLIAREIGGTLRSLIKRLPYDQVPAYLNLLVKTYPRRDILESVTTRKNNVAQELKKALDRNPS